jgi:hypothetical protein
MSNDLQLFRVTVTQTWSAEGEALVMAPNEGTARMWARRAVDLELLDADDDDREAGRARPEPMESLMGLTKEKAADLWLILPMDGHPCRARTVELDEFLAELSPERLEALRIAAIERDNGQLALLEAV